MSRPLSRIGHGALGVRSGLRPFNEMAEQSYCERRAYADVLLGEVVDTAWQAFLSNWFTTFTRSFDGVNMEVVGVTASNGDVLTRVETEPQTEGVDRTFYYKSSTGDLYICLTGNEDPRGLVIRVDFVRRFGSLGATEPLFGPEKANNANLQTWITSTNLDGFNELNIGSGGVSVTQVIENGEFAAEIRSDALASGATGGIQQAGLSTVIGELYWCYMEYATDPLMPSTVSARIRLRVTPVGNAIALDGRSETTDLTGHPLQYTGGERRRAIFPIRATVTSSASFCIAALMFNNDIGPAGDTWMRVYRLGFMKVHRYEYVEPRLSPEALPPVERATSDIFPGNESVSLGSIRLLNSDGGAETMTAGFLETLVSPYDLNGREVKLRQAGGFDSGQEVTFDDSWPMISGFVQRFSVDDLGATAALQNTLTLLSARIPQRVADLLTFPNMYERDIGRSRAILLGRKTGIKPIRINLNPTTRLPVYEVCDPLYNIHEVELPSLVWVYTDEEAARRRDVNRRVSIVEAYEWDYDVETAQLELLSNPGIFEVTGPTSVPNAEILDAGGANDAIDFVANGVTYAAFLTPGLYRAEGDIAVNHGLIYQMTNAMDTAVGVPSFTISYSTTSHLITITYTGPGAFSLLLATGTNKHRSAFPLAGFRGTTDRTGSATYIGDTPLFSEEQADRIVLRVDTGGYRDDAAGTYTGLSHNLIQDGPGVLKFLLLKVLRRPAGEVDDVTFTAGRTSTPQQLGVYIGSPMTLQGVVSMIQNSCHVETPIDGLGKWYWRKRATSAPELSQMALLAPVLTDRDFLDFTSGKSTEDVYQAVWLEYDHDAVTGEPKAVLVGNAGVPLRHERNDVLAVKTWLLSEPVATQQAWNNMLLAVLPRRTVVFTVKAQLLKKLVGDLVVIRRTRMLAAELDGMSNSDVFRIQSIKVDPQTHVCEVVAYTADLTRNSDLVSSLYTASLIRGVLGQRLWYTPRWREVLTSRPGGFL